MYGNLRYRREKKLIKGLFGEPYALGIARMARGVLSNLFFYLQKNGFFSTLLLLNHFTMQHHFGFEAAAFYWHCGGYNYFGVSS